MNKCLTALATVVCLWTVSAPAAEKPLTGSWCLEEEDLVITFMAKDSVHVTSNSEEGVDGWGKYEKLDSMFVASVEGDEVQIRMGYKYTWSSDSTIEAKTLFMTVNGDSVKTPDKLVQMRRCGADKAAPAEAGSAKDSKAEAKAEEKACTKGAGGN